ncbi:zinc-binding alcohol dehydrogenase [Dactylosporangium sp. NPDC051485]|uniref:zinc-dependent alcohol dehydrogenase n=1 Tax=Dactylosporangium sp. NPDC051485 TaxID=3154846 RepID=UPI00344A31BB
MTITGPGRIELTQSPLPQPGPREVLAATVLSAISGGTEIGWLRGEAPALHRTWETASRIYLPGPGRQYPVAPGYESIARVIDCGDEVTGVRPGDLIIADRPHAEWHVLDGTEAAAAVLPEHVTPEQAVFSILARVSLGAVHDTELVVGDTVVVMGLGVVGLLAAQQARLNGATVIGVDRHPLRCEAAQRFGITTVLAGDGDVASQVRGLVGSAGADAAIEATGAYAGLQEAIRCVRVGATVTTVASYHGSQDGLRLGEEYHRNRIVLRSSMTVNGCPHRLHPRWDKARLDAAARQQIVDGLISTDGLITHRFPFTEAADAYALLLTRPEDAVKVVLTYDHQ